MRRAGATREVTVGVTAPALRLAVRPAVCCAWCCHEIAHPREGQRFCRPACRQRDFEARRDALPASIWRALHARLVMRDLAAPHEIPPVEKIADALDARGVATPERRASLLKALGLTWDSERRAWTA